MDDKQKAGWMAAALLASAGEGKIEAVAAQVGAFYQGLRNSGVSEGVAILLSQTYIQSIIAAAAPLAAAKGGK